MKIICRVCLASSQIKYYSLLTVFPEFVRKNLSLLDLLSEVTSSKVQILPNLPQLICEHCSNSVKDAYKFISLFKRSQSYFDTKCVNEYKSGAADGLQNTVVTKSESDLPVEEEIIIITEEQVNKNICKEEIDGVTLDITNIATNGKITDNINQKAREVKNVENIDHDYYICFDKYDLKPDLANEKIYDEKEEMLISDSFKTQNHKLNEDIIIASSTEEKTSNTSSSTDENNLHSKKQTQKGGQNAQVAKADSLSLNDIKEEDNTLYVEKSGSKVKKTRKKCKDDQLYECVSCNKIFYNRKALYFHNRYLHNPNWSQEKGTCHLCGVICKTPPAYRMHMLKHGGKTFPCNQCDKAFYQTFWLKKHIERKHEKKVPQKYLCPHCGKEFNYKEGLTYHLLKHSKERNFVCSYCGFKAISSSILKRHERTHTGERPYKCKYCDKTFRGTCERNKHTLIHTGKRQFKCNICSKGFNTKYNMRLHMMVHPGEFTCEICNKSICDAEILKLHYSYAHKIRNVTFSEDGNMENWEENNSDKYDSDDKSIVMMN